MFNRLIKLKYKNNLNNNNKIIKYSNFSSIINNNNSSSSSSSNSNNNNNNNNNLNDKYNHLIVEKKWQNYWNKNKIFQTKRRDGYPKKYILDMFPYPSGSGLHVGHPEGYTATDILARYYRMCDYDVLHPMGWDAFGLPAEQHAINTNTHPAVTTQNNIAVFKRQLESLGFSYDWDRELSTTDIEYVRWTQWIFLKLFEMGLAKQSEVPVNWCPKLGTILANEEVIGGLSERGGYPVTKLPLRQWLLKITEFANELESDLEGLQWPEGTLSAQKSWIGKSEGANVRFPIILNNNSNNLNELSSQYIEIFTTRVDTLLGVTYLVVSPEHKLLPQLTTKEQKSQVDEYLKLISSKTDTERLGNDNQPSGVFLGSYVQHPLTNELLPLWVGDYVLGHYGTGAVMAVPAHDERDYRFAKVNNLPIKQVITSSSSSPSLNDILPFTEYGYLTNLNDKYSELNGVTTEEGKKLILEYLGKINAGEKKISYKLRDWTFSRQRYWGEPIPIYFPVEIKEGDDPRLGHPHTIRFDQPIAVDYQDLPLRLPDLDDFRPGDNPDPQGCLARVLDWRFFQKNNKWYARETNTMPQWAGSCWYYIRFADPKNEEEFISQKAMKDWLPVDIYIGGQEHAVLHLLYARFWHKALYKLKLLDHSEPFTRVIHQGLILGSDGEKMSKSRGNVVNPDSVVQEYGADVLRLYEMFMGPLEAAKPWQTSQLQGVIRFRERIYNLTVNYMKLSSSISSSNQNSNNNNIQNNNNNIQNNQNIICEMHRTIKKVTNDIETLNYNTVISTLMIYLNTLQSNLQQNNNDNNNNNNELLPKETIETLILLVSPIAPHLAEECWSILGHQNSLAYHPWPKYIEELCQLNPNELVTVAVQINGKLRSTIQVEKDSNQFITEQLALNSEIIQKYLQGNIISKTIYVKGKILNFVLQKNSKE